MHHVSNTAHRLLEHQTNSNQYIVYVYIYTICEVQLELSLVLLSSMSAPPLKQDETTSDGYDTSGWEKLELTSTDPCRTTLIRPTDGSEQYTITTDESGSQPITTYKDSSGSVIATLQWHLYSSDTLTLEGKEPKGLKKWLKVSKSSKELSGKSAYASQLFLSIKANHSTQAKSGRKVTFEVDGHKYTWEGYQEVIYTPMEVRSSSRCINPHSTYTMRSFMQMMLRTK